jgi:hypothetical protein
MVIGFSGMFSLQQPPFLDFMAEELVGREKLNYRGANGCVGAFQGSVTPGQLADACVYAFRLVVAALLIASFVCSLIIVFFKVPLLAVVLVFRAISLAFALSLLVCFVLRIVRFGALLLLEKRRGYSLRHACTDTNADG